MLHGAGIFTNIWIHWIHLDTVHLIRFGSFGYIWFILGHLDTFGYIFQHGAYYRSEIPKNPGNVVTASRRLLLLLGQLHLLAMPQLAMEVEFTGKINCITDGNPIHIYIYPPYIIYLYWINYIWWIYHLSPWYTVYKWWYNGEIMGTKVNGDIMEHNGDIMGIYSG